MIRAIEFTPFEELWPSFTAESKDWSLYTLFTGNGSSEETIGLRRMIGDLQLKVSQAWRDKVYADAGVKWEKLAEQRSSPGEQGPAPSPPPSDDE